MILDDRTAFGDRGSCPTIYWATKHKDKDPLILVRHFIPYSCIYVSLGRQSVGTLQWFADPTIIATFSEPETNLEVPIGQTQPLGTSEILECDVI